ncbi:MAG: hypothetical protein AABW49_02930 [Nanoarchaeota archaeon]
MEELNLIELCKIIDESDKSEEEKNVDKKIINNWDEIKSMNGDFKNIKEKIKNKLNITISFIAFTYKDATPTKYIQAKYYLKRNIWK